MNFRVRTFYIETLGARVLRIRLPRIAITTWWKDSRPHIRFLWLPRVSRRFPMQQRTPPPPPLAGPLDIWEPEDAYRAEMRRERARRAAGLPARSNAHVLHDAALHEVRVGSSDGKEWVMRS